MPMEEESKPQKRISFLDKHIRGESLTLERERRKPTKPRFRIDTVSFLGAPFCDGQNLEGADRAPEDFRKAGFKKLVEKIGLKFLDHGDLDFKAQYEKLGLTATNERIRVNQYTDWVHAGRHEAFVEYLAEKDKAMLAEDEGSYDKWKTNSENSPVSPGSPGRQSPGQGKGDPYAKIVNVRMIGAALEMIHKKAWDIVNRGDFLMTVGGDHSIASGTISAVAKKYPDLAVIWIDAHGDANTPEISPSAHYHGMPVAHLLGWFQKKPEGFDWFPHDKPVIQESHFAYIGLRDMDREESDKLRESGVHIYTMRDVDRLGIAATIADAIRRVDPNMNRPFHLSLDVDAIDPQFAPGTGTLARGGLSYREIHYICEELSYTRRLVSMEIVEINPKLDETMGMKPSTKFHGDDHDLKECTPTVQLGIELCLSALGKTIMWND